VFARPGTVFARPGTTGAGRPYLVSDAILIYRGVSRSNKRIVQILIKDSLGNVCLTVFGVALVLSLFVWLLGIEPFVRRRLRKSAFFLLPWAQWQDYRDGLKVIANKGRTLPWFFRFYQALLVIEGVCLVLLALRCMLKSF
jgi:hypothetical protein